MRLSSSSFSIRILSATYEDHLKLLSLQQSTGLQLLISRSNFLFYSYSIDLGLNEGLNKKAAQCTAKYLQNLSFLQHKEVVLTE